MQTKKLELSLETAQRLYKTADNELKVILESTFGINNLSPNLRDKIKTINDVFNELNEYITIDNYKSIKDIKEREKAYYSRLWQLIIKCFNQGWTPDWLDYNQYKYYMYFQKGASGWFLSGVGADSDGAGLGSYFYLKNKADGEYIGKQFIYVISKALD
jgi:hypothetical protein